VWFGFGVGLELDLGWLELGKVRARFRITLRLGT